MNQDNINILFAAIGLMLVAEGILPFVAPQAWRESFQRLMQLKDGQLRFIGLVALLAGTMIVLWATRSS